MTFVPNYVQGYTGKHGFGPLGTNLCQFDCVWNISKLHTHSKWEEFSRAEELDCHQTTNSSYSLGLKTFFPCQLALGRSLSLSFSRVQLKMKTSGNIKLVARKLASTC